MKLLLLFEKRKMFWRCCGKSLYPRFQLLTSRFYWRRYVPKSNFSSAPLSTCISKIKNLNFVLNCFRVFSNFYTHDFQFFVGLRWRSNGRRQAWSCRTSGSPRTFNFLFWFDFQSISIWIKFWILNSLWFFMAWSYWFIIWKINIFKTNHIAE